MLFRKIESEIEAHLKSDSRKVLLVDGARQVGKTYIIRYAGKKLFKNFIEINLLEDSLRDRLFAEVKTVEDIYMQISMTAGNKMKSRENTLIFFDEIQVYPHLLTLLKFLANDGKFTFIASGSLLGVTLSETTSIPMGSIRKIRMFPLDFEEFLYACGMNEFAVSAIRQKFLQLESLDEATHDKMIDLFRKYLLVGGLPDAVNSYIAKKNIKSVREIQSEIREYYAADASKYDSQKKLKIRRIYDLIPSNMENKKKRIVAQDIENKKGKAFRDYSDEFEYIISAGIALPVQAISNPVFPLIESSGKNLLKLYMNDVGILSGILYGNNIRAVLDDERSVNLGSVYESVVAFELIAHGHRLFYYDNRSKGEVDYLIDDYDTLSVVPIEVKSGKDYTIHSALNTFVSNEDYHTKRAFVLSNERLVRQKGKIVYVPVYYVMFM
ncbi:ATP-binding protein [bacterium]|nr:ATP-binding protein [bacterium]